MSAMTKMVVVFVEFILFYGVVESLSNADILNELDKLQRIVQEQNIKIRNLERNQGGHIRVINNLRYTVKIQRSEIEYMQQEMDALKGESEFASKFSVLNSNNHSKNTPSTRKETENQNSTLSRRVRINPTQDNEGAVAFYAYMSKTMTGVGVHHQLVFDVVKTNVGGGYHPSGVFIVPKSGLYVFTWSFRIMANSYHPVELVVNGSVVGVVFGRDDRGSQDQISATVVISVNKGDDVFLRSGDTYNNGDIYSDHWGYTYFAGWSIM